jgi:hypothetical protein
MTRKRMIRLGVLVVLILSCVVSTTQATGANPFEWWTVGSGGGATSSLMPPLIAQAADQGVGEGHPPDLYTPAEASGDWWGRVQDDLRRSEYHVTWEDQINNPGLPAAYQASNRANNLRTYFTQTGIRLVPRTRDDLAWEWGLNLSGFGYGGSIMPSGAAALSLDGDDRIEYQYAGQPWLESWYRNDPGGLQQGFTIVGAPSWAAEDQEWVLELSLSGDLAPRLAGDGKSMELAAPGGAGVLHYGGLQVTDARGTALPARLEFAAPHTFHVIVDAAAATYPFNVVATITGLPSDPDWTIESNQEEAEFGISVSTAGDVNGDGYSDVIVGARYYDGGHTDEGRAEVYYGSPTGLSATAAWNAESDQAEALFGCAVATAGDVNGDGYADVIVGAEQYELILGAQEGGRAYVYYGSASGLSSTPDWTVDGTLSYGHLGTSVSTAGDVNGDGYSDVIVGQDGGFSGHMQGRAFAFYGSASGLSTTAGWETQGEADGHKYGFAVATTGDVDGDGYADVIVGAPNYNTSQGKAYVYYGSQNGLDTTIGWQVAGEATSEWYGSAVGTAGDVNADGYSDVIVGAPADDDNGNNAGKAYLYRGSEGGLNTSPSWDATGENTDNYFGRAVSTIGDVDGDGYADIVVGAYGNSAGKGRVYVYYGGLCGVGNVSSWTATGQAAGNFFGRAVGIAGDVNGDGFSDLIVGAPKYDNEQTDEGAAYVYHGSPGGLSPVPTWGAAGDQENDYFGSSLSTAGDVNGDGYSDIIVVVHGGGEANGGLVQVHYGSSSGPSLTADWVVAGGQESFSFGKSNTAGDVNGDGYSDVIIGAPYYDPGDGEFGAAFVYYGSASGLEDTPGWIVYGDQIGSGFGQSVDTAGDVNGDGYADVIVSAPSYKVEQDIDGRVYGFYGSSSGLSQNEVWTADSDQYADNFGLAISTAGDVNGDGYSDIIIGANLYNGRGAAWVYHGSASGLGATWDWRVVGDQFSSGYGDSVSTAGDVNGDGYADVIVGAHRYGIGGGAFVYNGSADGLSTDHDWAYESGQEGARFGVSVNTAGDVNGDGYADVIVGANGYTGDIEDEGLALVFHGSPSGLSQAWDWGDEGDQTDSYYGGAVSTSGDVNGDGYADVVVGARGFDVSQPGSNEGRVLLYYGNGGENPHLLPRQLRAADSVPIAPLGTADSPDEFLVALLGRTPFGLGQVKLEWEVKPLGTLFDGSDTGQGATWMETGTSGTALEEVAGSLLSNTSYHWRVRLLYHPGTTPFQPHSRWLTMPWDGWNEQDLRTTLPTVSFQEADFSVNEGVGATKITLDLDVASSQVVTVSYATSDGSAKNGEDYTAASGTLIFGPGVISRTFNISVTDDALDETAEILFLTLSDASNALIAGSNPATLTILDDDDAEQSKCFTYLPAVFTSPGVNPPSKTINVDTCGANPWDSQPDSAAIQDCVDQAESGDTVTFTSGVGKPGYQGYLIDKTIYLVATKAKKNLTFTSTEPFNHAFLQATADLKGYIITLFARSRVFDPEEIDDITLSHLDLDGGSDVRVCFGADGANDGLDDNYGSWLPECTQPNDAWCTPGTVLMSGAGDWGDREQDYQAHPERWSTGLVVDDLTIRNTECGAALYLGGAASTIRNTTIESAGDHVHVDGCTPTENDEGIGDWSDGITLQGPGNTVIGNRVIDASDIAIVHFGGRDTTISNNLVQASAGNHGSFAGIAFAPTVLSDISGGKLVGNQVINGADSTCGGIHAGILVGAHMWGGGCVDSAADLPLIGNVDVCTADPPPPLGIYCQTGKPCQLWAHVGTDSTFELRNNFVAGAHINYLIEGLDLMGEFIDENNTSGAPRMTDWGAAKNGCWSEGTLDYWGPIDRAASHPTMDGWVNQRVHCER